MPVTLPATSARNFTPTSTAELSASDGLAGATPDAQMEHGEVGGGVPAAVVKDHVVAVVVALPAMSLTPLANVAVYWVVLASAADGVNVAFWVALSYAVVPATAVPEPFLRLSEIVLACTGSLKVALTVVVVATPVAPDVGLVDETLGGVVSVPPPDGENTTSTQ